MSVTTAYQAGGAGAREASGWVGTSARTLSLRAGNGPL